MPPTLPTQSITFENNRVATAVYPPVNATGQDILDSLELKTHHAVLLLIGGADSVDETLKPLLAQLFGRGIARAAAAVNAVIVDGGTESGVMAMMGQSVADRGFQSALVGVAPRSLVTFPGSGGSGETPLDRNHSHFVLVAGNSWGSETSVIFKVVNALKSRQVPAVALLAGGGDTAKDEAVHAVRQNLRLFVVKGSGGLADQIAKAWQAKSALPTDPVMAEIIADGRIQFHDLNSPVEHAERLIVRELGRHNVLLLAWEQFADYDLNAGLQQKRFQRLQLAIIIIGILGTTLALIKQVWSPGNVPTALKDWWFYWPTSKDVTPFWVGWWLIYYLLIVLPIVLTVLITVSNRFKQGNKWLLLRASAEAIKREIYRFRARSGDYKEKPKEPPPSPSLAQGLAATETLSSTAAATAATTSGANAAGLITPSADTKPPATPEQVLAERVEDITRRAMRTEVNSSSLKPYNKNKGFPPAMYGAEGGDDGLSLLTPDRYIQVRLGDQLSYYRQKAVKLERQLKLIQWSIFIVGGLGTLLAAINQQVWIALTTAAAAALTTYLSYQQTESTLTKYNQAATDLSNVKSWWLALPADEQAKPENVTTLVDHTEQVLQSELDGWVQQMQNALAELRKGQEKAPDTKDSSTAPKTEADRVAEAAKAEAPAAAAKIAAEKATAEAAARQAAAAKACAGAGGNAGANDAGKTTTSVTAVVDEAAAGDDVVEEAAGAVGADDAVEDAAGDDDAANKELPDKEAGEEQPE